MAAAMLLLDRGCRVCLADEGDGSALREKLAVVAEAGGRLACGPGALPSGSFDLCVASPAFAPGHPWMKECRRRDIAVVSELELGATHSRARILAVTGSKGKSSIVKLCADTLRLSGRRASPAGNYGIPLSRLALDEKALEWAVTEVSSFQMENTGRFAQEIGVLLNVQPDHLDRHASMREYRELKLKMFAGMKPGSLALVHEDVDVERPFPEGVAVGRFGTGEGASWVWRNGTVAGEADGSVIGIDVRGSWFDNPVFGVSLAAACAALLRAGLSVREIERGIREFQPLEHRMERFFRSAKGVVFVNDSKATSLSAMAAALRMVETPVYLIAGGLLKEKLDENTKELLTRGVKKVYLIGDCCDRMFRAWSDEVSCVKSGTLESAVSDAVNEAGAGETVLLSPGTASFDQFKNYCERGERFKDLVREVAN